MRLQRTPSLELLTKWINLQGGAGSSGIWWVLSLPLSSLSILTNTGTAFGVGEQYSSRCLVFRRSIPRERSLHDSDDCTQTFSFE